MLRIAAEFPLRRAQELQGMMLCEEQAFNSLSCVSALAVSRCDVTCLVACGCSVEQGAAGVLCPRRSSPRLEGRAEGSVLAAVGISSQLSTGVCWRCRKRSEGVWTSM